MNANICDEQRCQLWMYYLLLPKRICPVVFYQWNMNVSCELNNWLPTTHHAPYNLCTIDRSQCRFICFPPLPPQNPITPENWSCTEDITCSLGPHSGSDRCTQITPPITSRYPNNFAERFKQIYSPLILTKKLLRHWPQNWIPNCWLTRCHVVTWTCTGQITNAVQKVHCGSLFIVPYIMQKQSF